jgi:hypothetical protein
MGHGARLFSRKPPLRKHSEFGLFDLLWNTTPNPVIFKIPCAPAAKRPITIPVIINTPITPPCTLDPARYYRHNCLKRDSLVYPEPYVRKRRECREQHPITNGRDVGDGHCQYVCGRNHGYEDGFAQNRSYQRWCQQAERHADGRAAATPNRDCDLSRESQCAPGPITMRASVAWRSSWLPREHQPS